VSDPFFSQDQAVLEYLHLAGKVTGGVIAESELAALVTNLPKLSEQMLGELADESYRLGPSEPRLGWAIAMVADKAAGRQELDLWIRARAAWYLGRAANRYSRPRLAAEAVERAREAFLILEEEEWLAACDWQAAVLPWAYPDLK
jgi:hypothetical protein